MWLRRKLATKPDSPIGARSQALLSKPMSWIQEFIAKAQRAGTRILLGQKFARRPRTRGGSSIMAKWRRSSQGALGARDKRTDLPEAGGECPSRALAYRERS